MPRTDATEGALQALAARYQFSGPAVGRLRRLIDVLAGDPLAPTAIRDPARVIDDHLADSLVALELEQVRDARRVVDLGSGAGVPGLPLAIALPLVSFTLLESSARKCAFIARTASACGIDYVEVAHARVEQWHEGLGRFDVATARALAPLEVVVEYAAPLLRVGGTLVAWRGKRDAEAEGAAEQAAARIGLEPGPVVEVTPSAGALHRHLHLMSKVMETPDGFPRRPGMARKRPLSELSVLPKASSDRLRR